jgi:hypothetical protein
MKISVTIPFLFFFITGFSQTHFPDLSPKGTMKQKVGFTTVEVNYERPAARGRKIFGDLVPFDKLWRTGAGKCTKITFSSPVVIADKKVAAGTYSLFTIPGLAQWTIILNSDTTLYGTGRYDQIKDVLRFKVKPERSSRYFESLTVDIDVIPNNAMAYICWENTQVGFPIETETEQLTSNYIEQHLLNDKSTDADEYATAAEYYFYLGLEFDRAITLVNKSIERKSEPWYFRVKIDLLERQKKYSEATEAARQAIVAIEKRTDLDATLKQEAIEGYRQWIKKWENRAK